MQLADYNWQLCPPVYVERDGLTCIHFVAAKAALRRKQVHERSLQQTNAQIDQIEQQINSIETANINQETLNAMKTAGKAMKDIHGNLTIDKVDATMYDEPPLPQLPTLPTQKCSFVNILSLCREELREQHALGEEIANAITSPAIGEPVDEDDLEAELEAMEQEAIDERMLKTGPVPVANLPGVANGPIKGKDKVQAVEEDEEEELRQLQAKMAI